VVIHDADILHITTKILKIEPDKILNDVKKREIPRFKLDPPAASVATAVQQLIKVPYPKVKDKQRRFFKYGICAFCTQYLYRYRTILKVLSVKELDGAAGSLPERLDPLIGDSREQDIDLQARLCQLNILSWILCVF
jgi:hypothetical protein